MNVTDTEIARSRLSLDDNSYTSETIRTRIRCCRNDEICSKSRRFDDLNGYGSPNFMRRRCDDNIYPSTFGTRRAAGNGEKGITIVNIYSNEKSGKPNSCIEGRDTYEKSKSETKSKIAERNKGLNLQFPKATCFATDDERKEKYSSPLPYWGIAMAAAHIKQKDAEYQYNKERAAKAWDRYLSGIHVKSERITSSQDDKRKYDRTALQKNNRRGSSYQERNRDGSLDSAKNRGSIVLCGGKACEAPKKESRDCRQIDSKLITKKPTKSDVKDAEVTEQSSKRRNKSAPPQIGRPFYGTTELEKCSLNAINHLLRAERELRRMEFTAGGILPKARQYIEQVDAIHQDLKTFNTELNSLRNETNKILEQKAARHFHFVIKGSPTKKQAN